MHYKTCEICGLRSGRLDGQKRIFMAKFPLDEDRCKQWVKATGKEDLVYIPIEKLHQLKHICGSHFLSKDFKKKKSQLKKNAVPSVGLTAEPLLDELFIAFPLHIVKSDQTDTADGTKAVDRANIRKCLDVQDLGPYSPDIHGVTDVDIHDNETHKETEDQLFSWQRTSEINCEDFHDNPDNSTIEEEISEIKGVVFKTEDDYEINGLDKTRTETDKQVFNRDDNNDLHKGYKCDMCKGPIRRFRYSCVECANYDLCGACEARAGHPQHYLLRVPRPRPHGEIQLIIDTIRRFLTADLKSLRAEANFVSTLMDEMKSEALSEADSDPVPDEPDYPIQSDVSSDEQEDCEMEVSNVSHASATHDDTQEFTYLDEDILEERDIPKETKDKNVINIASDRDKDSQSRLQNVNINHKPERRIIKQTGSLSPSNALDKVSKRLVVPQNYSRSTSNALGKVSKSILGTLPKTVSINKDVFKLLKATNDADTIRNTVNTIKHSLQSQVSIKVQRLSKKEIKTATNT